MGNDRTDLNMDFDDLDDFKPKATRDTAKETQRAVDRVSSFPSREETAEGQLNMKGSKVILERFKAMCKDDRRSYVAMLEILMDSIEKQN